MLASTGAFTRGAGYWVYAPLGTQLANITRSYLADTDSCTLNLTAGWNLIGNPFQKNLDWLKTSIKDGALLYSQNSAYSNGLIYNQYPWSYDKAVANSYFATSNLRIWAYWSTLQKS